MAFQVVVYYTTTWKGGGKTVRPYMVRIYFDERGQPKHLIWEELGTRRKPKFLVTACGKSCPDWIARATPRMVNLHNVKLVCPECEERRAEEADKIANEYKEFEK